MFKSVSPFSRKIYVFSTLALIAAFIMPTQALAREYLKTEFAQKRGYTPTIVTQGGKTVWISGQIGVRDEQGNSLAGDLNGQARAAFKAVENEVKKAGGKMSDVVSVTVYLTDPRQLEALQPIREEFWADGNFPTSTTITVSNLPLPEMMLEISAIAVIGDK
ncbi:MAG: RidA family protein [Neisseria sp.]|nr:RidA family protein [Neisseria sp.]